MVHRFAVDLTEPDAILKGFAEIAATCPTARGRLGILATGDIMNAMTVRWKELHPHRAFTGKEFSDDLEFFLRALASAFLSWSMNVGLHEGSDMEGAKELVPMTLDIFKSHVEHMLLETPSTPPQA